MHRFEPRQERDFARLFDVIRAYLDSVRTQLMTEALDRTGWVQTQAAELLGMSFRSFRYYAKKAGLTGKQEATAEESTPQGG